MRDVSIPDLARDLFEAVGLSAIRRELVLGSMNYLGDANDVRRIYAQAWVAEQEAELEREKEEARELEARRFKSIRGWTIVGVIVAIVAAVAAVIAALPVVKAWIR
ncbi:MAG TPA: hypothetical protein VIJ04_09650 [Xanthobacteraceae bacterium]